MLEIKNLHVSVGDRKILKGLYAHACRTARSRPSWGRTAPASRRSPMSISGREGYEITDGEVLLNGENILELDAA